MVCAVLTFGPPEKKEDPFTAKTLIQEVCQRGVVWPFVWGDPSKSMMFVETHRPAVAELLDGAKNSQQNCAPFALVNVSGSGKTSALFQLARHSWVCYVTCGTVRGADVSGHGLDSDVEFQNLVKHTSSLWRKFLDEHDYVRRRRL